MPANEIKRVCWPRGRGAAQPVGVTARQLKPPWNAAGRSRPAGWKGIPTSSSATPLLWMSFFLPDPTLHAHVIVQVWDIEEGDGADLDAFAVGRIFGSLGVFERRMEGESGAVIILIIDLEDETFILCLLWVVKPLMIRRVFQGVILPCSMWKLELI